MDNQNFGLKNMTGRDICVPVSVIGPSVHYLNEQ